MFSSDLPPPFHHENHREQGKGRQRGLKAGSNTMALRCYLCPSLCWRDGGGCAERGKGTVGVIAVQSTSLFFSCVEQDAKQMVLLPAKWKWTQENLLVLISRPSGETLSTHIHGQAHSYIHTHITDTRACTLNDMHGLALLALIAHHLHAEKVCRRSVKQVLGLRNVFPMFIAIAYVALECKECYQTLHVSVFTNPVVQRQWVFRGQADGAEKRAELAIRGKGKQGNLC